MAAAKSVANRQQWWHASLLISFLAIVGWSAYAPADRFIWLLEATPAVVGAAILLVIYQRIKLTMLLYFLIWLHAVVLLVGAHWTYSNMPVFDWLQDRFGLARNHYDRVGHVFQGLVPAMIAREIFIRADVVRGTL